MDSLIIAKQLVSQSRVPRVVTPSGRVCLEREWDGEIEYLVKPLKNRLAVIHKGKDINKPVIKKAEPKENV